MAEDGDPGLVDLLVEEQGWASALPELEGMAADVVARGLDAAGVDAAAVQVCLLATNDAVIANLNRDHRGKPTPTNVLSWPTYDLAPAEDGAAPGLPPLDRESGERLFIGDVAIALETTSQEASDAGRPLKDHVIHLILHGVLHLLGYDHMRDGDAARMEEIERNVLAGLGLPDPYLEVDADTPCPED